MTPQPSTPIMKDRDCRAALLTPRGRGAVATISVTGGRAAEAVSTWFQSASGRPLAAAPLRRIVFGRWAPTGEELVACRLNENRVEIHCHGGSAAADAILQTLRGAGCRPIDWQEWAAENAGNRLAAAALAALADARTQRTAAILLNQHRGALGEELRRLLADLESARLESAARRLHALAQHGRTGVRLTKGWRVVLAGAPNVGKSSLMNAIVGFRRSIVVDQPGTTRDVVTAQTAIDGWPVELADTAGLRPAYDKVEAAGVARAQAAASEADVVVLVTEAGASSTFQDADPPSGKLGLIRVVNKCDLAPPNTLLSSGLAVSALRGDGIGELIAAISAAIVPAAPLPEAAVPFTEAQVAAVSSAAGALDSGDLHTAIEVVGQLLT